MDMLNKIFRVLWDWRYVIIYAISFVIFVISHAKQWTKAKAYSLMLLAKSKAKDGILQSGQAQEDWTVKELYIVLKRLKIPFVTEDSLRPIVQKLYSLTKDYLDDGKLDNSVK